MTPENGVRWQAVPKRYGAVLGYARVSDGGPDLSRQKLRLTNAGAIRIFVDTPERTTTRPGLDSLFAFATEGDTLAVVQLDRLGRTLSELLAIVDMLKVRNIALISQKEEIDTNAASGDLIFHAFEAIACFERGLVAERDIGKSLSARDKRRGRPPSDVGKIAAALELVGAGLSPAVAARQTGLGRSTVYREVNRAGIERNSRSS